MDERRTLVFVFEGMRGIVLGKCIHHLGGCIAFTHVSHVPTLTFGRCVCAGQDHQEDCAEDAVLRVQADLHEGAQGGRGGA